jgi:MFS family permease
LDLGDIYEEVGEALGNVLQIYAQAVGIPFALLILFIVLGVLLSLVFNILTIYVSIALGCMLKNHRAVMSMVFYFILLCVYQVLGSFISVFLVSYLKDLPSHRYPADKEIIVRTPYGYNLSQTEIEVCRAFFFTMLALFVIGALLCVGYYFIIVKADEKKLELQ